MKAKFRGQLWKRIEDYEGEITLTFKIPLSDAEEAMKIHTQTELEIEVES